MTSATPLAPALFVSHGAPTLVLRDIPARRFLASLAATLPRPRAILAVTAHWCTEAPVLGSAEHPETIHDFGGFPDELYAMTYPAPGAPDIAARGLALLREAGIAARTDAARGLDHGTWIPARLLYPEADIPIAQLSVQPAQDPAHHYRVGAALRPLREAGVLVVASGTFTHNLRAAFQVMRSGHDDVELPFTAPFVDWIDAAVTASATEDLLAYRVRAPHARDNHPTDEHFLPFFVALGAGSEGHRGRRIHHSTDYGMAMDAYAFD